MTDSRDSIPVVPTVTLEAEKSRALAKATADVRDDAGLRTLEGRTSSDWSALDDALFAKLDREDAQVAAATRFRGSRAAWGVLAGITAAAAAMLVLAGHVDHDTITGEGRGHARASSGSSSGAARERASKLSRSDSATTVTVNGLTASRERPMAVGDAVEVRGGRAVFVEPSKVTWALESASRISVGHAGGPLVLALERGALEAQVAHVELGEAFAVDIDSARVAVHGTHLRVERVGEKVIVDLTDGVISVGPAPLRGSTYGSLVTAPAHVEFLVSDPRGTLHVEHTAGFVRAATLLPIEDDEAPVAASLVAPVAPPALGLAAAATRAPSFTLAAAGGARTAVPSVAASAPIAADSEPVAAIVPDAPTVVLPPPAPVAVEAVAANTPPATEPVAPVAVAAAPKPGDVGVAAAVKACWEKNAPPRGDVTITVRTTLTVESDDEGAVHVATFDPPLPPAVQSCASEGIYRTHFAGAARIAIPIVLTR